MKVFMSWSGERSRLVGELLDDWLQCVIQSIKPWMSTKDIDRGALWFSEINNQLQEISVGIVILTKENKEKPWILFEAGALAKGLTTNRVCVFLVDLVPNDVRDPLAQFNLTLPDEHGMWQLVSTLNSCLKENALREKVLLRVFETYWPQFNKRFVEILKSSPEVNPTESPIKTDEILYELMSNIRMINRKVDTINKRESVPNRDVPNRFHGISMDSLRTLVRHKVEEGLDLEDIIKFFDGEVNVRTISRLFSEERAKIIKMINEIDGFPELE